MQYRTSCEDSSPTSFYTVISENGNSETRLRMLCVGGTVASVMSGVKRGLSGGSYSYDPNLGFYDFKSFDRPSKPSINNTMGDPLAPKRPSIPEWQHGEASSSLENPNKESNGDTHENTEPPPPRALLLEQAAKFLKQDDIKDAPQEKKVAFLKSKGLTEEEIHKLLGLSSEVPGADEKEDGVVQSVAHTPLIYAQLNIY